MNFAKNTNQKLFKTKYKLMLILVIIGCFMLLSVTISNSLLVKTTLHKNTSENTQDAVKTYSQKVSDFFKARTGELELYSSLPVVKTLDWNKIEPFLKEQYDLKQGYYDIFFVAKENGDYDTVKKRNAGNLKDRAYWPDVMSGKTVVSEPLISKSTGSLVSVIIAPIKDDSGKVIGAVAGNLNLENFYDEIKNLKVANKDSYSYMVNKDGLIISHPNKKYILNENISEKSENISENIVNASKTILSNNDGNCSYTDGKKSVSLLFYCSGY
ncbi:MAG TPA: cache domain-containing protein [Clostridia bacterium]|nr:cache domain-containing protein [Clostridia bacterium]